MSLVVNPFRSEAQRRWMWANHPAIAKKWAKHTPKGKLPARVKNKLMGGNPSTTPSTTTSGELIMELPPTPIQPSTPVMFTFTKVEHKVLGLLSDGLPHPRKEVFDSFEEPHMALSTMRHHISNVRRKLRLIGQDIICGVAGRRIYYQHVRLMLRASADMTTPSTDSTGGK